MTTPPLAHKDHPMTPGIHPDIPEATYHADKHSLSHSGAKLILDQSPAHYRYAMDNPPEPKDVFDFGHAAHTMVLGVGAPIKPIDAPDWRTKAAQEAKAEARANGETPLLLKDYDTVRDMASVIQAHPIASVLLDPNHGKPEVSGAWEDPDTGVLRRFRLDWLPDHADGRLIIPDYKTAATADPRRLGKAFADYGYHSQDAWYTEGAAACGLASLSDIAFVFIVQEKTAPYAVSVVELDDEAKTIGAARNRRALGIYADCVRTGIWPSYSDNVELISLPPWYVHQHDMENL